VCTQTLPIIDRIEAANNVCAVRAERLKAIAWICCGSATNRGDACAKHSQLIFSWTRTRPAISMVL
jgi:hypothetical protein